MMKKFYLILLTSLLTSMLWSQTLTQTLRGRVIDLDTQAPLIGANVFIQNSEPTRGATTDLNGFFKISSLPVGRYNVETSYIGYAKYVVPDLVVSSAKEIVLTIELKEAVVAVGQVIVTATEPKAKPMNPMAIVSARRFTVEETRRYAGGLDDPARLAASFAGVSTGSPQDNAIVVRGNSAKGLLWLVEGVKIPSPNHFPDLNVAGGGVVSILSSQVLSNSDFYTGAFPAEYGNALAGVFDLRLREGNSEKREHTLQAGIMGLDMASEGPLPGIEGGSYLFNFRYATFSLIDDLIPTDQIPRYSDLSFKVAIPSRKYGKLSIWGVGAVDELDQLANEDSSDWRFASDRLAFDLGINIGVVGLTHKILAGKNAYISSSLAQSMFSTVIDQRRLDNTLILQDDLIFDNNAKTTTFSSFINGKFGARHTNRTGIILSRLAYNLNQAAALDNQLPLTTIINKEDATNLVQFYSQSRLNISENLLINLGFHSQSFAASGETTFEPRFGLSWKISPFKTVSLGYGNHSQMEELRIYLLDIDDTQPNLNLGLSRAHHYVLGYEQQMNPNLRLKIEPYYQLSYNVPVVQDSSYSMLNFGQDWTFNSPLVNDGTGANYGVDITLERFLANDMYYLFTGSLFDSKYKGGDSIERPTAYASGYTVNGLFGKEFQLGKTKQNVLGLNMKLSAAGGARMSPPNLIRTKDAREIRTDETMAFEHRAPDQVLLDISIVYRKNKPKHSSTWALQVKNILGSNNRSYYEYDYKSDEVITKEEVFIVPSLSYKIEF